MHVALITSWNTNGGISMYSNRLAEMLREVGVEVTPVPIEQADAANPRLFNTVLNEVPADADVIHVQFEAGLFGQLGMSGVCAPFFFRRVNSMSAPVVTTLHEVHRSHPHQNRIGDHLLRWRDFVIERSALHASDVVVVHTNTARNILSERHGRGDEIVQMHHPVEVDAKSMDQTKAKQKLGFDGQLLLTLGWVEEKKRYVDVIDVLPEIPGAKYLIGGEPRAEKEWDVLEAAMKRAEQRGVDDRVHHLGYVEESRLPVLFNAVDAVVLPYDRVSQSGTLNLALGYECPVLTSSLKPFEELREEFGCPETYRDLDDMHATLRKILNSAPDRNRLVDRAAEYASNLTWPQFARDSLAIYERVARVS